VVSAYHKVTQAMEYRDTREHDAHAEALKTESQAVAEAYKILTQARRLPEAKNVEDVSSAHEAQSIDLGKA